MKKTIYILIFTILIINVKSQNINTEIKYLLNVNKQNKDIIKDNLRNAEICAYKLIQNPDSFKNVGNLFFNELAKSYYLTGNYEFTLLTYYRQRCFFPLDNDAETKKYFFNSIELIKNANHELLEEIYSKTTIGNTPKSYNDKFELFLKSSFKSGFKNSDKFEDLYSDLYRKKFNSHKLPYWIEQQNFYSKIGIKSKHRKEFYSFSKKDNDFFIPKNLTKKQKHKICNAAIKYYFHIKNKDMVRKYRNFCKESNIKYCLRANFIR